MNDEEVFYQFYSLPRSCVVTLTETLRVNKKRESTQSVELVRSHAEHGSEKKALGCNKTLPKGFVCDSCNGYFADMDKDILLNRYIALYVGAEGIPGKRRKIRREIGC